MINWPEAYAYLLSCPPHRSREQLLRLASGKVKVKAARPKIRLPRGVKAKAKLAPIPKLKKELDRVFSLFIRQRDAREGNGYGYCVTCGHFAHWKDMDCGHYVPRQDLATRWDERNCHLQCKSDNGFRGGEPEKMAAYIDTIYGKGTAEELRARAKQPFRLTRYWLTEQIAKYKALVGERSEPGERLRDPAPSPVTSLSPQPKDQP